MHRPTVGVIALVLLGLAVVLTFSSSSGHGAVQFGAACARIGAIMATLWLALPELQRLPRWAVPAVLVALVVVLRFPKLLPVVLIALLAVAILRPRSRAAARRR